MSDPTRGTLITVGAPKSAKTNVIKTVRLTINLDESNESKYSELNYKELVFAEESQRKQNGKPAGLDPFSDNDDDVERVARKFEQKYGGKSTYGRKKARSKQDDFADIGAGYDENDSFIDNTHGYDEMIPPECDTLYGGFYINSGSLEFKTVPQNQSTNSDEPNNRRNKRRISSSSSEDDSSESSSDSESGEDKETKPVANGAVDSHKTEHRKKKNKKNDKKKAKKVQRTDSSAATSGKQTSDENNHADAESVDCGDSRTSQSDSLTSKPAPSSENAITSDSSRDLESKPDSKLPAAVCASLDAVEAHVARALTDTSAPRQLLASSEPLLLRLHEAIKKCACDSHGTRVAWSRAALCVGISRAKLMHRLKQILDKKTDTTGKEPATASTSTGNQHSSANTTTTTATTTITTNNKRKHDIDEDEIDVSKLTDEEREAKIVETLQRLKELIDERKPSMLANYNAECERVQEERKKLQIAQATEGVPHIEKRLPKRRFPWCGTTRALLARLTRLATTHQQAAVLLAKRALPLFPNGFVRMPTLLRQADLSKEIKVSDVKRARLVSPSRPAITNVPVSQPVITNLSTSQTVITNVSTSQPAITNVATNPPTTTVTNVPFSEPIQFPSSLTVTTTTKTSPEKTETEDEKYKSNSIFSSIRNTFSISKDLLVEKDDKKEDLYIPPNNIGSITITPVPNQTKDKEKKVNDKPMMTSGLIRVKSPAALNDMVNKKDIKPIKKLEKHKDKRIDIPLHIDTSYQPNKKETSPKDGFHQKKDPSPKDGSYKKDPSPKDGIHKKDINTKDVNRKDPSQKSKDEVTKKQIETMRVAENNIPRPALVPVHHSPTFAKPDKRPPEVKKKKDVIVVSDVDPLSDVEPVNIDDSSSDVEVIETDKSDSLVPSDKKSVTNVPKVRDQKDEATDDIDALMRNIREMEHSQEPTKLNSNSYGGVITSARHGLPQGRYPRYDAAQDKNKFAERSSLNKMDGSNTITGEPTQRSLNHDKGC